MKEKKENLEDWIRNIIANIGWRMFLWGNKMTREEYWQIIYNQEKSFNHKDFKKVK